MDNTNNHPGFRYWLVDRSQYLLSKVHSKTKQAKQDRGSQVSRTISKSKCDDCPLSEFEIPEKINVEEVINESKRLLSALK